VPIYANGRDTSLRNLGRGPGSGDVSSKTFSVHGPVVSGSYRSFFTENGINVSRLVASIIGSGSPDPSVAWTLRFGATRNLLDNEVIEGGTITSDLANGSSDIVFSHAGIPPNSFVCLDVLSVTGTVDGLDVTIIPELV
jgi:hypothetical protein